MDVSAIDEQNPIESQLSKQAVRASHLNSPRPTEYVTGLPPECVLGNPGLTNEAWQFKRACRLDQKRRIGIEGIG